MTLLERKTARPDWRQERAGIDCKTALKPNCRKSLPPVLPLRKSILLPALTRAELVMGPPRPGDHRTIEERWQAWHFDWEDHFRV